MLALNQEALGACAAGVLTLEAASVHELLKLAHVVERSTHAHHLHRAPARMQGLAQHGFQDRPTVLAARRNISLYMTY